MSDFTNTSGNNNGTGASQPGANSSGLRPPSTSGNPTQAHSMGSAPIGRSSSPIGTHPGRYSLGGTSNINSLGKNLSTPSEQMLRKAQQQGGLQEGLRSPSSATHNMGLAGSASPITRFGPRPSSEMLGMGSLGGHSASNAEQDAIDKWFEDLQHYEATLEEMAAASLDQNFKEELSAIEQWFRVLSEAERTAALYSLLQESTQVQIRFFITVLQQMARSDPMSALLSPSANLPMADQMEAKLASLGLKSPTAMKTPASPGGRGFNRQSDAYLSPNAAQLNFASGLGGGGGDAAATLAAQRAKLKANRVSAPGTFTGDQRNFSGGGLDQVTERGSSPHPGDRARSPGVEGSSSDNRPKSIDALGNAAAAAAAAGAKSPRRSGPLDDQLSPVPSTGNWASMVNTPLNNMFDDGKSGGQANVNLDAAASQLAGLTDGGRGVTLDQDVSKYQRRKSGQPGYDQSQQQQQSQQGSLSPNLGAGWASSQGQNDFLRQAMQQSSPNPSGSLSSQFPNFQTMSPNSLAGLQSPSGGFGNGLNMQMMNAMAAMGGLNNVNAAQFLAMQQQILQNQQQIAAMAAAAQHQQRGGQGSHRGPAGLAPGSTGVGGRRSPGNNAPRPSVGASQSGAGAGQGQGKQSSGGGGGDEEVPDLSVLNDVPAWLRHLRLHKYTPNFESSNWKDMVVMTDSDLEAHGVAALGARRKLLKTFRAVREKHGIKGADDAEKPGDGAKAAPLAGADNQSEVAQSAGLNPSE